MWTEGGHGSDCAACNDGGELICCELCPDAYHIGCAVPALSVIPQGDWYCPQCIESGASRATSMNGSDIGPDLHRKWIQVFKKRWRTCIVLEIPTITGEFLVKWWRADGRGGKVVRINVDGCRVLVLPEDVQAFLNEKTKNTNFNNLRESTAEPGGNTRRLQDLYRAGEKALRPRSGKRSGNNDKDAQSDNDEDDLKSSRVVGDDGMTDTYIAANTVPAAFCAAGSACRAVDIVVSCENTNAFVCTRPPGHHAGRYGCTRGCISTGFCLLNNAAIAMVYARVRWGFDRVAVVDFDVHMGNGTAELLANDPRAFFATVYLVEVLNIFCLVCFFYTIFIYYFLGTNGVWGKE